MHHGNIMDLSLLIICGVFALSTVFIACELSHQLIETFEKIEFTIEQFVWYEFPNEIKRLLPMIIAYAQEPVSLQCFGSIYCSREVFKHVTNF